MVVIVLAAVPDPMGSVNQVLKQTWEPYKNCGHWTIGSHYKMILQCLAHKYKQCIHFYHVKASILANRREVCRREASDTGMHKVKYVTEMTYQIGRGSVKDLTLKYYHGFMDSNCR